MAEVIVDRGVEATRSVWEMNNSLAEARRKIRNEIAESKAIEEKLLPVAEAGLQATRKVYNRFGKEIGEEPDWSARHKFWRDIMLDANMENLQTPIICLKHILHQIHI